MTVQTLAIYFAGEAHKDQMYGESPYIFHLSAVDTILAEAGYPENHPVRTAAWLHDTIEDTETTQEAIAKRFGSYVAHIVWCVSNETGCKNRTERTRKTYPKTASLEDAIALKVADRTANLEHSLKTFSRFGLMYVKEDISFRAALYEETPPDRLIILWERYFDVIEHMKDKFGHE